jgi:hypothetical protein
MDDIEIFSFKNRGILIFRPFYNPIQGLFTRIIYVISNGRAKRNQIDTLFKILDTGIRVALV